MKKTFKALIAALVLLMAAPLTAKDFDWSQCWCNYGAGIKQGDVIVNIDGGLWYGDLAYSLKNGGFILPPVMAEIQFAQPIWKLPFTFGGYFGTRAYGWVENDQKQLYWGVFFGGEASYHMQLPPENLDLYATTRVGGGFPLAKPASADWNPDPLDLFHPGLAFGASWYFNKTFGLNLEFGAPMSKFGVSLKF